MEAEMLLLRGINVIFLSAVPTQFLIGSQMAFIQ